jgi:hypothetical protein
MDSFESNISRLIQLKQGSSLLEVQAPVLSNTSRLSLEGMYLVQLLSSDADTVAKTNLPYICVSMVFTFIKYFPSDQKHMDT